MRTELSEYLEELLSRYVILCATKSGCSKEKRVEFDIVKELLSACHNTAAHTGDGE